ncbi:MAG TPA: cell division protein FtsZ [Candidatus Cloacimonadota bacterium]|nr:cell division protein FtsZ [Candidatus Cloacimonadota bacterium]HQL15229.1 cell division protein FtsZ [Candidatus Cloacimonadota bacterium]
MKKLKGKIMIEFDEKPMQIGSVIKIIGVGGAGGNAINTMIDNKLSGVEFIAANTDMMDLQKSKAKMKLQIGKKLTRGLGTGANPELGRQAAEESQDEIRAQLEGADMVFIAAGMGGGTGTGGAPVVAKIARELGILTLGIVSKPFASEGAKRMQNAEDGIRNLSEHVDTMIVIPNEKLKEIYSDLEIKTAFYKADNVLYEAAKAVSDIINLSGYINVDFADVRTVMQNMGYALMGTGTAEGEGRAINAARGALLNPLLADIKLQGCQALLINITAGPDMKMSELDEVSQAVISETGSNANIIMGLILDEEMKGKISVTIIATGLSCSEEQFRQLSSIHPKPQESAIEDIGKILSHLNYTEPKQAEAASDMNKDDTIPLSSIKTDIPSFLKAYD